MKRLFCLLALLILCAVPAISAKRNLHDESDQEEAVDGYEDEGDVWTSKSDNNEDSDDVVEKEASSSDEDDK